MKHQTTCRFHPPRHVPPQTGCSTATPEGLQRKTFIKIQRSRCFVVRDPTTYLPGRWRSGAPEDHNQTPCLCWPLFSRLSSWLGNCCNPNTSPALFWARCDWTLKEIEASSSLRGHCGFDLTTQVCQKRMNKDHVRRGCQLKARPRSDLHHHVCPPQKKTKTTTKKPSGNFLHFLLLACLCV